MKPKDGKGIILRNACQILMGEKTSYEFSSFHEAKGEQWNKLVLILDVGQPTRLLQWLDKKMLENIGNCRRR